MRDDNQYLEEHHCITECAIGLAKLLLKRGDTEKALKVLETCCSDLDEITKKYQPASAKMQGLK